MEWLGWQQFFLSLNDTISYIVGFLIWLFIIVIPTTHHAGIALHNLLTITQPRPLAIYIKIVGHAVLTLFMMCLVLFPLVIILD